MGPTTRQKTVRQAHKDALDQGLVTAKDAEAIWWLYCLAKEQQLSNATVAAMIGFDTSNIGRIYTLTYNGGKVGKVVERIKELQKDQALEDERKSYGEVGFIQTKLSKAIFETCDAARLSQTIALVYGDPQTGKTEALKRYASLNKTRTVYLEVCEAMSPSGFLRALATGCGAITAGSNWQIWQSLIGSINPNTLIIVDEVHQPFSTGKFNTGSKIIEHLRGLFNAVGCGVVLCGTNTLRDELFRGRLAAVFEQTRKRGVIKVQCPNAMPLPDVWKFVQAYGLSRPKPKTPEYELINRIRKGNGISELTKYLKAGKRMATKQGVQYDWNHFQVAHDIHQKYANEGWWL